MRTRIPIKKYGAVYWWSYITHTRGRRNGALPYVTFRYCARHAEEEEKQSMKNLLKGLLKRGIFEESIYGDLGINSKGKYERSQIVQMTSSFLTRQTECPKAIKNGRYEGRLCGSVG